MALLGKYLEPNKYRILFKVLLNQLNISLSSPFTVLLQHHKLISTSTWRIITKKENLTQWKEITFTEQKRNAQYVHNAPTSKPV